MQRLIREVDFMADDPQEGKGGTMNSLRSLFETDREALTAKRVLVVGGIFGVVGLVLAYIPKIPWADGSKPLGVPPFAWAMIIALLMSNYYLFVYAHCLSGLHLLP